MTPIEFDGIMIEIISESTRNTKAVCRREHIKGVTRHERVSEFVTQLRRAVINKIRFWNNKNFITKFCDKSIWYDAGVLDGQSTNFRLWGVIDVSDVGKIDNSRIRRWVRLAAYNPNSLVDELADEIDCDLERMTDDLTFLDIKNAEMDRINLDADEITSKLVEIFS